MEEIRRQRGQVLCVAAMGIDNPCKAQERHDPGASLRAIVEPVVIEKHPEGKNSV